MINCSIIIPARNEENNLKVLIPHLIEILQRIERLSLFEIIIINHNSLDRSSEILKELQCNIKELKVIEINNLDIGLGDAVKDSFKQAQYDYILTMDGDQSHPPMFIKDFINEISMGADVIIGGRYMKNQIPFEPKSRYRISRLFNSIPRFFINKNISDYTTGFRCFKKEILNKIHIKSRNFSYHLEINIELIKKASKLVEIPIRYEKRMEGKSKLKYSKEFWGYFGILLKEIFFF